LNEARQGIEGLRSLGVGEENINLLSPGDDLSALREVPTVEGEAPGMGTAVGALVGGVSGAALGPVFIGLAVAGLGPVSAVGLYAAALMGAGGALAGAAAGGALERSLSDGLPRDEIFVYEDALRRGRTVVIALSDNDEQAVAARQALLAAGAESIDAARDHWWLGLRTAEEENYRASGRNDFSSEEESYRFGFEAAQDRELRERPYKDAVDILRRRYPEHYERESFREGYARGQAHCERTQLQRH
jgi:hypothetical protein